MPEYDDELEEYLDELAKRFRSIRKGEDDERLRHAFLEVLIEEVLFYKNLHDLENRQIPEEVRPEDMSEDAKFSDLLPDDWDWGDIIDRSYVGGKPKRVRSLGLSVDVSSTSSASNRPRTRFGSSEYAMMLK